MIGTDKKVNIIDKLNVIIKYVLSIGNKMVITKGDSGATNHYWREEAMTY